MSERGGFGVLLPHFGEFVSGERVISAAQRAEAYGFDSVWVRDHLIFQPHGYESQDRSFLEPLGVLTAVGSHTRRVRLGTSALIPHRHPIYLAQQLATLTHLVGPNRVVVGLGRGRPGNTELAVAGVSPTAGPELHREQVDIFRQVWSGQPFDHHGQHYQLEQVQLCPTPLGKVPVWYCGNSAAAVRRAVEYCDGWLPGRIPLYTLDPRIRRMRRLAAESGRPLPVIGCVPVTSPARTREQALAKVNLRGMLGFANNSPMTVKPPSGRYETADDLAGALMAGPPDEIAEQVRRAQALGCEYFVFDLRFRFGDWDECLALLGEEVLPAVKAPST